MEQLLQVDHSNVLTVTSDQWMYETLFPSNYQRNWFLARLERILVTAEANTTWFDFSVALSNTFLKRNH